jgi:hypothetical protein
MTADFIFIIAPQKKHVYNRIYNETQSPVKCRQKLKSRIDDFTNYRYNKLHKITKIGF